MSEQEWSAFKKGEVHSGKVAPFMGQHIEYLSWTHFTLFIWVSSCF